MNFTADLSSITWPIAALLALVLLRPIFEKYFGSILAAMNKIEKMPDQIIESIQNLEALQNKLANIPEAISAVNNQLKDMKSELETVSFQQSETNDKLKSEEELTQEIMEDQQKLSQQNIFDPNFDWAASFEEFKKSWDDFSDDVSKKLYAAGLDGQKNFMPLEISKLTEENSKYKLSKKTAEYVQSVYSENRRIRRIKKTDPSIWYTQARHYDLMSKLNFAKNEIDQVVK